MVLEYWSASRINDANYCLRRFFLEYILKDKPLNLSVYERGTLMHSLMEHFWEKLGIKEEVEKGKKKYFDASSFTEHAVGQWWYQLHQAEARGDEIGWQIDDEKYMIANGYIPKHCPPLFDWLVQEGPRLDAQGNLFEGEIKFNFELGNRRFTGFIDDIRVKNGDIIIRDYKTERPWVKGVKLSGNPQLTVYCLAVSKMILTDRVFAERLGVSNIEDFMQGNRFISPRLKPQLFMISAFPVIAQYNNEKNLPENQRRIKTLPEIVNPTERCDKDYLELELFLDETERHIADFLQGRIKKIPATRKGHLCDYCDMQPPCSKRLNEELSVKEGECFVDARGQLNFGFVAPYTRKVRKRRTSQVPGQRHCRQEYERAERKRAKQKAKEKPKDL